MRTLTTRTCHPATPAGVRAAILALGLVFLGGCQSGRLYDPQPEYPPVLVEGQWLGIEPGTLGTMILLTIGPDGHAVWEETPCYEWDTAEPWEGTVVFDREIWGLVIERDTGVPLRIRWQSSTPIMTFVVEPVDRESYTGTFRSATFGRADLVRERLPPE